MPDATGDLQRRRDRGVRARSLSLCVLAVAGLALIGATKLSPVERSIAKYEAAHPGVRHGGGKVIPPKLIDSGKPRYPPEVLTRRRPAGMILLETVVDEHGRVKDPVVLKGLEPDLRPYVLESLRKWRYEPARLRGKPVPVFLILAMNIHVQ